MKSKRRPPDHAALYRIAEQQGGYFTPAQAVEAGFDSKLLWHHEKAGKLHRVRHGIYRFEQFPASPHEDLLVAWLRCGPKGAISHDSALAVYQLSDAVPGEIHVTVPRTASRRRPGIRQHTGRLHPGEVRSREGLRLTSVPRTIADVARTGLDEGLVRQAIEQAFNQGLTDRVALLLQARRRGGRAARLIRKYVRKMGASP